MNRFLLSILPSLGALAAAGLLATSVAGADDSAAVKAMFADPPRQFASAPLWVWNDMLTEEQIKSTLGDLAAQGVKQAFVHPRPGLMTPYLSNDWFRLWRVALKEAERLDMNIWIYDENSYPSGFAGGFVPDAMPESRGKGLHFAETNQPGKLGDDAVAVYRLTDDGFADVTAAARAGQTLPEGRYLVASLKLAPVGGWFGGKSYVDLLHPGVTEKFLEITMGAYQRELGPYFGGRLPGVFTDEPHLTPAGGIHWSDRLPRDFQRRFGYDLMEHLPSLVRPVGDFKRVRHDYQQFLLEQFIECWAKPFSEYCEKHGLEFTGHYWEHGWPDASHGGDNMAMYAWHQRPSIDTLMNEYDEGVHAQFGNVRVVKELSSVANQMGRQRTLCEAYGAGGWDLRFEDMKRIGDWLYVLGVNTLDEHLSYITIRGARKRDHPQSFSYHEPWWDDYHVMARYFTRLSLALSSGQQVNSILLFEPTTSAWLYQPDASGRERVEAIGASFQALTTAMEKAQAEYDIGCEDIMGRHGWVLDGKLIVGRRQYDTLVLPPMTETVNARTMELFEAFAAAGGTVLSCGPPPTLVDGRPSDRGAALAKGAGFRQVEAADVPGLLLAGQKDGFAIRRTAGDQGILLHHRRRLADGQLLMLVNTSIDAPSSGTLVAAVDGMEQWDPQTGEIRPYAFSAGKSSVKNSVEAAFELAPCGSLLLFLSDNPCEAAPAAKMQATAIPPVGPPEIRRIAPNVLTIDYVDVTAGGQTRKNVYFYAAGQFAFQHNGMERNPWDSAVQFRDELISRKFPPESGFEATYRFTVEQSVPEGIQIVIERPDLYAITCNGKPVTAAAGQWWLDRAFGRIDLAGVAKVGQNEVTVKAAPFTVYHELESAYLLGEFSLKASDSGFAVAPPSPLKLGPWNAQGQPFYAAGVAYAETFRVPQPAGRYRVSLPQQWYGSVAKVRVNGKPAGSVAYRPWQCDVTDLIQPGDNRIEVTVIGTLKNTLGPHHSGPVVGKAWPPMFQVGPATGPPPGQQYHTLDYGLFAPFVLMQMKQ